MSWISWKRTSGLLQRMSLPVVLRTFLITLLSQAEYVQEEIQAMGLGKER